MSTPTDLESDVRAMLARRAGDVDAADLRPGLPDPNRVVVPLHRPARRRPAALAVAAAVVLLALVGAVVVANRPDGGSEVATDPTPSTARPTVPGAPEVWDLPPSVDLGSTPPLWTGGDDPAAVANDYLRDRMQLDVVDWEVELGDALVDGPWARFRWRLETGSIDDPALPSGIVHLRRDPDGWSVVAALTDGVDLSRVTRDAAGVSGGVHDPGDETVRVEVRTLDGEPVGEAAEGMGTVVLDVPAPVALGPVALRLTAVGGHILSVSEVVLVPPGTEAPAGARLPIFDRLPAGVDPLAGEPLFIGSTGADPAQTYTSYVESVFGETRANPPAPTQLVERDDVWVSWSGSAVPTDAEAWPFRTEGSGISMGATVLRQDAAGAWGPVAITSDVVDMATVRREGGRLAGRVVASVPAPLRLVATDLDGNIVATSDLVTVRGTTDLSVLDLDAGQPLEVGDGPIIVRAEVGSAPGQVQVDGVEVAGVAAVALPADDGGSTDVVTETTTPDSRPLTPRAEASEDLIWRAGVEVDDTDAVAVARSFLEDVAGLTLTGVGDASGDPDDTLDTITADLDSGLRVVVSTGRTETGWGVVDASSSGGFEPIEEQDGVLDFGQPAAGATSVRVLVTTDGRAWQAWGEGPVGITSADLPEPPGAPTAVVVLFLADDGRVVHLVAQAV